MQQVFRLILLSALSVSVAHAQTYTPPSFADVDNNYRTYVNNVFGALEANRVPTGLLSDYGFDFTDPKIYNGSVLVDSTLMEQGIYSDLYKTIFTSKFNSSAGTLRHPSLQDSLCYIARQKEVITLSGLLFRYNTIDPNAQANGKMQTVNGQLKDKYVNSVWQNPYQEFKTVAISPSTITYDLTYCSVVLPSNLFISNISSQISSIQFNADDGAGYRALPYNTQLSLNYADTGWKHWIFKITLTGGQLLYSHSKVHFTNTSNAAGSGGYASRGVPDGRPVHIRSVEQFNGAFGDADVIISFHDAGDQVLRRPLIVAEGFDPGWIISPEEPEGESTFEGFIATVRNSRSTALTVLISDDPSQYDIVYVNWRNGTDYLQRNELVLEEVIRWVNRNKQPDLNTGLRNPNVVLGTSMGGVVARMALGRMDRGGGTFNGTGGFAAHETGLYVSLDAPHQGANVPLGYQAAARHAAHIYISTGPIAATVEIVQFLRNGVSPLLATFLADQPAGKQLLTNRIDFFYNQSNTTNQQFLQELRTQWAYPANIRNVAISDGSECAIDQEFAPGSQLLYHYRSTKTRFIGDLIFMLAGAGLQALGVPGIVTVPLIIPGSNKFELTLDIKAIANGGGNQVYYGNIKLTKKVLWLVPVSINIANKTYTAPTGILPFDTYSGGFYTLTLDEQPGGVSQDWMFKYDNSFYIQRRFDFIPTTSALDIGQGNTALTSTNYTARYIGATPPAAPFNTPFANFTTSFNQDGSSWQFDNNNTRRLNNQPHEWLFLRSANWLAEEMNGNTAIRTNCSAFCGNGIITGPSIICNSETFTAPFGEGVTYNWTCSNPSAVTFSGTGNTRQVMRNTNEQVNINILMTGACGSTSFTKSVRLGTYTKAEYSIYAYPATVVYGQTVQFGPLAGQVAEATSYNWIYPSGGWTYVSGQGTRVLTLKVPANSSNQTGGDIGLSVGNACGSTSYFPLTHFDYSTSFRIAVSPNPTKGFINIIFSNELLSDTNSIQNKPLPIHSFKSKGKTIVTIFDINSGLQVKQYIQNEIISSSYNYNIREIKKGIYILQMDRNNHVTTTKLIVE